MLSTPYFTIKSVAIAKVAPPDKGFMIIIGIISVGIQKSNDNGLNKFTLFSITPEFFNIPMQINTPNNVGNIIRSAFCFGIDGLILPERDACGITPAVVRTSAGYSEQLPIYQVGNVANALEKLKRVGYWIIGFDVNTNTQDSLTEVVNKYDKCVFVFGSEGEGMRDLTKKQCDILIRLPMAKGAESLNVANTSAIVGWEVMKNKSQSR